MSNKEFYKEKYRVTAVRKQSLLNGARENEENNVDAKIRFLITL